MKILGINGSKDNQTHYSSAALIIDGEIIGAYEEERFNRQKESRLYPQLSINNLLKKANISIKDIDYIATPSDLDFPRNKWISVDHHIGHLCDAYYQSGFKSCACIIIDGCGTDHDSISIYSINDEEIKIIKKYDILKSLGFMYKLASGYTGTKDGEFMGLSSYGRDLGMRPLKFNYETKEIDVIYNNYNIKQLINSGLNTNGIIDIIKRKTRNYYSSTFYPYIMNSNRDKSSAVVMYYADFAKTIQETFNEVVNNLVYYAKEMTNEENLILSGGCIQNCIGNNKIVESKIFKNVFVPPAPHDAGSALGYALYAARKLNEPIKSKRTLASYNGKEYSNDIILKSINKSNLYFEEYNEDKVVNILKDNKIIAWYQGGAEIGPRALGHRSILANPANRENLYTINNFIKHRAIWRPLAPIVPSELFDLIFDIDSYDLTEFMLRTLEIKSEWRNRISAVCHIDNSTRPQRLIKEINPELYDILMKFYRISGIPCLINTSFNDNGEPIIETPDEAINMFNKTEKLDYLIFNTKFIVSRN